MKWQSDVAMVQKKPCCYGTEEAIALIIEPGSDSVMSDLEHSDDETDETYILPELENESDCD